LATAALLGEVVPASSAVNVSVMEPRSRKPRTNALRAAMETRLITMEPVAPPLVVKFVILALKLRWDHSRYKVGRG